MNEPDELKNAVDELLAEDAPEGYGKTLNEFYEAWNSSVFCDGTTAEQRSVVLTQFKAMRRFFYALHKSKRSDPGRATFEPWLG